MKISKSIAWITWAIAAIFYAYQYVLRVMPSIMFEELSTQFDIDGKTFGQFSGIYYIGYAFMHLPIGLLLDRYGPRKIMSVCILLNVAGMLPILFSNNWILLIAGRLLIGIGSSAAILGTFKIIKLAFSEAHFTRMLSLAVTIGLLGAIYGGGPVNYLCNQMGYIFVVELFSIIGLLLAIATFIIAPDTNDEKIEPVLKQLKTVFKSWKLIFTGIFSGFMVGPLEGFADVWGSQFFKVVYGLDDNLATSLPSIIFVGMCFGAPVLSLMAEKTGKYMGTIVASGVLMLAIFVISWGRLLPVSLISVSFVIVGVCSAFQILAVYKASTYVKSCLSSLAAAIANMILMSFGYGFHSVIGYVVDLYSENKVDSYIYGLSVIPISLFIGSIGFFLISLTDKKSS